MAAPPPAQSAPQPPPPATAGVSGPGSAGASVPGSQQPQAPQQQQPPSAQLVAASQMQAGQSGLLQQQQQDFDPVQRYKLLIPQLKESLQNLMKVAAQNLVQNTNIDNGQKSSEGGLQRFDKSLEEFYALCDQLELCLVVCPMRLHGEHVTRLAYECLSQSYDSAKHSPTLVPTATKPDAVQAESLPYPQYLSMIKAQIGCAKDIHNALLECSNKVTGKLPTPGGL
ncbi:mediator of RNA polymerase II transcription subunit 29 isoform X1 [Dromiciops gliroides]|uniref:mediator of RNA polymerase II transcription subunit 29 isoform X1 n=1 Tax=Dromiciops gliroides TaxID=33562 RepID=UPI001CC5E6D3|nr:mediator of RNA polymerase II transcription subunit 29 isoform X1 [Dromiciops gliroides]